MAQSSAVPPAQFLLGEQFLLRNMADFSIKEGN